MTRIGFTLGLIASALAPPSLFAQPRIGVVPGAEVGVMGATTICMSLGGHPNGGCLFYEVRSFRSSRHIIRMRVDGRTADLREVGRATTRTAYDREYRETRSYTVQNYRAADGTFTAELWTRSDDIEDGGDCGEMRGGLTVRKRGRQTHIRLEGAGCTLG